MPIVTTPLSILKELPITDNEHLVLEYDCSNVDEIARQIFEKEVKPFNYNPPADSWEDFLVKEKSNYEEEKSMKYLVRATAKWQNNNIWDTELTAKYGEKYVPTEGETWEVDFDRKEGLIANGFATLVKEIPDNVVVLGTETPVIEPYDENEFLPLPLEEMTRDELFELANELGLKVPKNTKIETLIKKINEKQNS